MTESDQHGRPDLDTNRPPQARHSVTASVEDTEAARVLMQELEEQGVPPNAISITGVTPREDEATHDEMPEAEAFGDTSRWVVIGAAVGGVIGGVLGAVSVLVIPNISLFWAIVLGVIFGSAVGGAIGGMRVAQYNSPAWRETYEVSDSNGVEVGVHDGDPEVVDRAAEIMRRHGLVDVDRTDD